MKNPRNIQTVTLQISIRLGWSNQSYGELNMQKNRKFSDRTFRKVATQNTENGEDNTLKSSSCLSIRSGVFEVPFLPGRGPAIMDNWCSTFRPSVMVSFSNDRNVHLDRSTTEQANIYNIQKEFQLD